MADGYEVDPAALRAASSGFYTGAAAVDQAAARLSVAQLVPAALGEVEAAYELASAFAEFVGEHGDDLRKGASWVNDAGDGLVENADEYARKDVFPYGRP